MSAFATPILGGIAGPVTKYVVNKLQNKKPQPSHGAKMASSPLKDSTRPAGGKRRIPS